MKKNWIVWALLPVLAFSCAKQEVVEEAPLQEPVELSPMAQQDNAPYEPGVAYVYVTEDFSALIEEDLKDGMVQTKSDALNNLTQELGVTSMRRLFPDAGEFEERTRREGLHRWYKVEYDPANSLTKADFSLSGVKGIEYVEGQRKIRSTAVFNDPMLSNQWHYINATNKGVDINVEKVWSTYTAGDPKVIVSVVDSGVDLNHEDLAGNTIAGGADGSKNFTTGGYVINPDDHGTHVAGTIAAVNNNGLGVCGIAGGNAAAGEGGVKILSCQIFGENGGDTPAALKWGADHGAVISQNSWGYVVDTDEDGTISADELERAKNLQISSSEKAAVDYFIKYAGCDNSGNQLSASPMKGGVVIFAAGNDGLQYGAPANYDAVIAVGAMGADGKRASFSNYGDWVDIAAPGTAIRSTVPGGYGNMQGTSMACPHVSGVAALVVSYFGGPGFTADMLKERLLNGANPDILPENAKIGPLVDALGAFMYGNSDTPKPVSEYTATPVSNNIDFSWKVTGNSENDPATGYVLFASTESLSTLNPAKPGEKVKTAVIPVGDLQVDDEISGRLPGLEFETTYYVALAGYDYGRNFSALSPVKTVKTEKNNPPVISTSYEGDYRVRAYQVVPITYSITDPDGHDVKVEFTSGGSADAWQLAGTGSYILTLSGNAADPGNYTASVKATDSYGLSTTLSIPYTILENQAPVVIKTVDNMIFHNAGEKFTLEMDDYIDDPDGETLKYTIKISNPSVVNLNQQGNVLYGTTLGYGVADVTLSGADAKGLTANQTFKVLVRNADLPIQAYPSQVKDIVYVSNAELNPVSMTVSIVSSSGGKVFDGTVQASAFEPASIDLSKCAPGVYSLSASYAENSFKQTIVKL